MKNAEQMDPPFYTNGQATGFAVLIAVLLVLPFVVTLTGRVTHPGVYASVSDRWGNFSYISSQMFRNGPDIDVLILGTSFLYEGIDAPFLERELTRSLGRKADVVAFATNWRCEALNYLLLRDVLQRRKVRMLLFSMPYRFQQEVMPHVGSFRWALWGEDDRSLRGLGRGEYLTFHAEAVLGAPRHLLSLVRADRYDDSAWRAALGTERVEKGIFPAPFVRFTPRPPELNAGSMTYSSANNGLFHFTGPAISDYQAHYLRLTFELVRRYRVPVVLAHVPLWVERHDSFVTERSYWPEMFGTPMTLVGIPPATLFNGLTEQQIGLMYYITDDGPREYLHLNRNGSEYFTRVITPAIVESYVQQTSGSR